MSALWSLDAERGVLGALLDDNSLLEMMSGLSASHFHEPIHRVLFEDIARSVAQGGVADAISLRPRHKDNAAYLLGLVADRPRLSVHVREYAALVLDMAARRQMKAICDQALMDLAAGVAAPAVLSFVEQGVRSLDAGERHASMGAVAAIERSLTATPGLKTGFQSLDRRLGGLHPGDLILLAARPSMGKSALARNIAIGMAYRDKGVHFASLEMSEAQLHERSVSALSFGGPGQFEYSALRRADRLDHAHVRAMARRIPTTLIIDDRGAQTVAVLESSARDTRRRVGSLGAVIVDYIQIMRAVTSENRVQQVTEISSGLKAMAKRLGVPVIALSQLSRANEAREDRRPQLSDLRDSGSLEQDADVVIGLYREGYYIEREEPQPGSYAAPNDFKAAWLRWDAKREAAGKTLEAITLKQRHGPIGTDLLEFEPAFDVIRESDKPKANLRVVGE